MYQYTPWRSPLFKRCYTSSFWLLNSLSDGPSPLLRKWPDIRRRFQQLQNDDGVFPLFKANFPGDKKGTTDEKKEEAAVLVLLCNVNGECCILFTRRSDHLRRHAAEVSFPGGHIDEDIDASVEDAALRETEEELLPRNVNFFTENPIEILGRTTQLPSLRGTPVTPVLGVLWNDTLTTSNLSHIFPGSPKEVEKVFAVSIKRLLEVETSRPLPENRFRLSHGPVFPAEHGEIWGLTAYILRPLLHKLFVPVMGKL